MSTETTAAAESEARLQAAAPAALAGPDASTDPLSLGSPSPGTAPHGHPGVDRHDERRSGGIPIGTTVTLAVARLPERVEIPERKRVLAASAPWLGALLNVVPGLGTGYVYQRRWRAWWITGLIALLWTAAGALLAPGSLGSGFNTDPIAAGDAAPLLGMAGLLGLSLLTAAEAFLAARKARHD